MEIERGRRRNIVATKETELAYAKQLMVDHFSLDDLRELTYDMEIQFDDIIGSSLTGKVVGLIDYCKRRNRMGALADKLRELRPFLDWPQFVDVVKMDTSELDPSVLKEVSDP